MRHLHEILSVGTPKKSKAKNKKRIKTGMEFLISSY